MTLVDSAAMSVTGAPGRDITLNAAPWAHLEAEALGAVEKHSTLFSVEATPPTRQSGDQNGSDDSLKLGRYMAAELGQVAYWTGCAYASLLALLGLWLFSISDSPPAYGAFIVLAVMVAGVWLIGRYCLYVVDGR